MTFKKVNSAVWATFSDYEKAEHILKQEAKVKTKVGISAGGKVNGVQIDSVKVYAVFCDVVQISNWHTEQYEALTEAGASLQNWQNVLNGGEDGKQAKASD